MEKQTLFKIFFYPLAVLVFAACIATLIGYPLFLALDNSYALERITSKLTLLLLILSIYPLSKWLHYSKRDLGYTHPSHAFRKQCFQGFIAGLVILSIALLAEVYLGIRLYDRELTLSIYFCLKLFASALLSGLLIAFIEETLFRGLLFRFIQEQSTTAIAILLSALFYAALHFLKSGSQPDPAETTLITGFQTVAFAFANLANPEIFDSLLALFFVGVFLAIVRSHTGSITLCIGLHASWVFLIKVSKALTDTNNQSEWLFLVGNYDAIIGYLVAGWLAFLILLYFAYNHFKTSTS